jgi:hypothetical protein
MQILTGPAKTATFDAAPRRRRFRHVLRVARGQCHLQFPDERGNAAAGEGLTFFHLQAPRRSSPVARAVGHPGKNRLHCGGHPAQGRNHDYSAPAYLIDKDDELVLIGTYDAESSFLRAFPA